MIYTYSNYKYIIIIIYYDCCGMNCLIILQMCAITSKHNMNIIFLFSCIISYAITIDVISYMIIELY